MTNNQDPRIRKALEKSGVRSITHRNYLKKMIRLGDNALNFMNAVDSGLDPKSMSHAYDLQHSSQQISKLVTSISCHAYYTALLEWMIRHLDEPCSYLDLGCGNGTLTLALATLWPNATGVGIDCNAAALDVAKALKSTHEQQESVSFLKVDMTRPLSREAKKLIGQPKLIVSAFLFHEIIHDGPAAIRASENVASLMGDGSKLISLDRFPHTEQGRGELIDLMDKVGLETTDRETWEVGDERFPLTVFIANQT